jgi:hypothetical protein
MVGESYAPILTNSLPLQGFVGSTGEPTAETKTFSGIGEPARIKLVNGGPMAFGGFFILFIMDHHEKGEDHG